MTATPMFWVLIAFSLGLLLGAGLSRRRRRGGYQPEPRARGPIIPPPPPRGRKDKTR